MAIPLFAVEPEAEFQQLLKAAEAGDAEAQFQTAIRYAKGIGTDMNKPRAAYWLKFAADQRYAPAEINLGIAYMTGSGIKTSREDAYAWLYRAAQRDFKIAKGLVAKLEAQMPAEEISRARKKSYELGKLSVYKGFLSFQLAFPPNYEVLPRAGKDGRTETVYFFPKGTPPSKLKEAEMNQNGVVRLEVIPSSGEIPAGASKVVKGKNQVYLFTGAGEILETLSRSLRETN